MTLIDKIMAGAHQCGDCLLWKGGMSAVGVPAMWFDGKAVNIRRELWLSMGKRVKSGHTIRTKCNEERCVCPDHLVHVNYRVGAKSALHKARIAETSRRTRSKLTPEAVAEIRASEDLATRLAERHGISIQSVVEIQQFRRWAPAVTPFAGLGAR